MGLLQQRFLEQVQTPARYLGLEHNSIVKDAASVRARFALCYPDTYEIGMSHLGSLILYSVINSHPEVWCERAYHPWFDASELMRREGLTLTSLESHTPLAQFDFVGLTLQHELNYTAVLSLLDLAQITLRAAERRPEEPLVIAGGPCAYNPEPVADFFDLFVIGEGEEVTLELLDAYLAEQETWGEAPDADQRAALLARLAQIEGVYVPRFGTERTVRKRLVQEFEHTPAATRPPVPYPEIVHDRGQIEINRGCTRGCRYCQAGMVYRPVRERSVETLVAQATEVIDSTGYDEVSLVSLNCPDYTHILPLVDRLHEQLSDRRVAIGLPSLRIDSFSVELAERVQRVKKTGLTFAPEAGSQRLRDAINKGVTEDDLRQAAGAAFQNGWHRLKLYFMIGLPGETEDDVHAIADLVVSVLQLGREVLGPDKGRLALNVSIAGFIPKPHTPFQWARQNTIDELEAKQTLLRELLARHKQVKLSFHSAPQAVLEGLLARGGRDWADLIEAAYREGAVFESWSDRFDLGLWLRVAGERGRDLLSEAQREWAVDAPLPWDHISCGVSKDFLAREARLAESLALTTDCRFGACSGCGLRGLSDQCASRSATEAEARP
ncbi:TIGR03960 family B12-binding radical SAM protein [bacterium]|nr:TIGR03960 family B12-binding radical SAM protein [bacterium]